MNTHANAKPRELRGDHVAITAIVSPANEHINATSKRTSRRSRY